MDTLFGTITSGLIGVSLAASCGFRVFVPLLVMSIAVKAGLLELAEGWAWLGSWTALIAFFVATLAEIAGYYIPWFDHLLDTLATPAAVVAGTVATAACISGMDPLLQWSAAIIAGGGLAAAVQGTTVLARAASTATTGGLGNPVVASAELLVSSILAILAIVVPVLAGVLVCLVGFWVIRLFLRRRARSAGRTLHDSSM